MSNILQQYSATWDLRAFLFKIKHQYEIVFNDKISTVDNDTISTILWKMTKTSNISINFPVIVDKVIIKRLPYPNATIKTSKTSFKFSVESNFQS